MNHTLAQELEQEGCHSLAQDKKLMYTAFPCFYQFISFSGAAEELLWKRLDSLFHGQAYASTNTDWKDLLMEESVQTEPRIAKVQVPTFLYLTDFPSKRFGGMMLMIPTRQERPRKRRQP